MGDTKGACGRGIPEGDAEPGAKDILGVGDRAKVLLLGTFHFAYPNLDAIKTDKVFDVLSPEGQAQVEEVAGLIERNFRPTRVAVEVRPEKGSELAEEYQAYRERHFTLPANEVYQLGFRLAGRLGHAGVYPIDEWGRLYEPWENVLEYARVRLGLPKAERSDAELEQLWRGVFGAGWGDRYQALANHGTRLLTERGLRSYLLHTNSKESIAASHGIYLQWAKGEPGDYALADHITGWWYNRNLRIFSNLKAITESPDDRILVIFGSGHLPILRHCLQTSLEHELVEVSACL